MVNTSRINVPADFTLTSTLAHACGLRTQIAKAALKPRKNWKTASNARRRRARTTSQVRLLPTLTSLTQKIARNSTFASTESNPVSSDVQLEKSSMMNQNVAMHQKTFLDGKFQWKLFAGNWVITENIFRFLYSEDWYKESDNKN